MPFPELVCTDSTRGNFISDAFSHDTNITFLGYKVLKRPKKSLRSLRPYVRLSEFAWPLHTYDLKLVLMHVCLVRVWGDITYSDKSNIPL